MVATLEEDRLEISFFNAWKLFFLVIRLSGYGGTTMKQVQDALW